MKHSTRDNLKEYCFSGLHLYDGARIASRQNMAAHRPHKTFFAGYMLPVRSGRLRQAHLSIESRTGLSQDSYEIFHPSCNPCTVFRGEDGSNVIFLLDVYKCSESLRSRKAKQYPTHYKDSRTARYKDDIAKKKICADCVGLIKGYNWVRPDRV